MGTEIDQPPFLDIDKTLWVTKPIRKIAVEMAPMQRVADMTTAQLTPRFAAMCANGSMTVKGDVWTREVVLAFDLAVTHLGNQMIFDSGSGLTVSIVNKSLVATVAGVELAAHNMSEWLPHTVVVMLDINGGAALYVNNRLRALRYEVFGVLAGDAMRFGGAKGTVAGMCGAIDNFQVFDYARRDDKPPLIVDYNFDGPAPNAGHGAFTLSFDGAAGLLRAPF